MVHQCVKFGSIDSPQVMHRAELSAHLAAPQLRSASPAAIGAGKTGAVRNPKPRNATPTHQTSGVRDHGRT